MKYQRGITLVQMLVVVASGVAILMYATGKKNEQKIQNTEAQLIQNYTSEDELKIAEHLERQNQLLTNYEARGGEQQQDNLSLPMQNIGYDSNNTGVEKYSGPVPALTFRDVKKPIEYDIDCSSPEIRDGVAYCKAPTLSANSQ